LTLTKKILAAGLVLALTLAAAVSCGKKKAGLQEQAVLPDKTLFENGMGYLNKGQQIKARLSFQTLINTYEESDYLEQAKYFIAYSYLREGGVENLIQAEQAFKDFKLFFPTSELADDAQAHIVKINMHMMKEPNRDLTYARRSQVELRNFLSEFPDSTLVPEMHVRLQFVEDTLATSIFLKGEFYHRKKFYKASSARFRDCVQQYKQFGRRDQALFLLGDSLDQLKNYDESTLYYSQVVRGYPFSSYFEEAKDRLRKQEKPIPDVDNALAEENKKVYYAEGSLLTSPFRVVWDAFGIGDDKQWEELEKKREEEEKARVKSMAPGKSDKDKNPDKEESKGGGSDNP
jgi:outer membrane assembly lipoprotein YfiO